VLIPESVTSIGALAFGGCRSLGHVELPRRLESIGDLAFCGCEGLTNVVLPDSVKDIGYGAFMGCTSLSSVRLPDGLAVSPERNTFYGCNGLRTTKPLVSSPDGWKGARDNLCHAVSWYTYQYMSGPISYSLTIDEIDEPDASYIGEEVASDDLEKDIRSFMGHGNWAFLDNSVDPPVIRRKSAEFAERVIVDTLRRYDAKVFRDNDESEECWGYYHDLFNCFDMISLRFLLVEGKWYAMVFDWSD